jgi:RNA polymerase sigma-70 factor (ECF subfamily)
VRHAYLNGRRRERSRPQFVAMGLTEEEENVVDRTAPGPEAAALRLIDDQRVLGILAELPEAFRSVLALVDLEGLHYAEAAEVLGCPIGTVMSRLHRGRLELARRLKASQREREVG